MQNFSNRLITILIFVITAHAINAQKLKMTFGDDDNNHKIVTNGQTCSLGNWGNTPKVLYFYVLLSNEDVSNILEVSEINVEEPDSPLTLYVKETSLKIDKDNKKGFFVSYACSEDITPKTNKLTFKTNDPKNPSVELNFTVNPDKGQLLIRNNNKPIVNNTIDIGEVPIYEIRNINLEFINLGKGHMRLKKVSDITTQNKMTFSFSDDLVIGNNQYTGNTIRFSAIKKGEIKSSFIQKSENGIKDSHKIKIKGKIVAPVANLSFNSDEITNGSDILLPDNDFKDKEFKLSLRNSGDYKMNISRISVYASDEMSLISTHNNTTIDAGKETEIKLSFKPERLGEKSYKLLIETDGYKSTSIECYLKIKVLAPKLSILDESNKLYGFKESIIYNYEAEGESVTKILTLKNSGNKTLNIKSIIKEDDDKNLFSLKHDKNINIKPGETSEIKITYTPAPQRRAENSIYLKIESDDHFNKKTKFKVAFKNSYSQLIIKNGKSWLKHDDTADFEQVSAKSAKDITLVIENSGTKELKIKNLKLTDNDDNYFRILNPIENLNIPTGKSHNLIVRYQPSIADGKNDNASLKFETNDYQNKTFKLLLKGSAIKPTLQLRTYGEKIGIPNNKLSDYGILDIDDVSEHDYTFANIGNDILEINNFEVEAPEGTSAVVSREINDKIDVLGKTHFKIKYSSSQPGERIFTIRFQTNDYEKQNFSFRVKIDFKGNKITSIDSDVDLATVKLFPNPVVEELTLKHNFTSKVSLNIYNSSGVIIHSSEHNNSVIQLNNKFKPGIYIMQIKSGNDNICRRFVVSK